MASPRLVGHGFSIVDCVSRGITEVNFGGCGKKH